MTCNACATAFSGTGCTEYDHHPFDARARRAPHLVERAHNLRLTTEEYRGILLLECSKARVGPPCFRESEAHGIEPRALKPRLQTCETLRIGSKIEPLVIAEVGRQVRRPRTDERDDHLLVHQSGGNDLALAPGRCDPLVEL